MVGVDGSSPFGRTTQLANRWFCGVNMRLRLSIPYYLSLLFIALQSLSGGDKQKNADLRRLSDQTMLTVAR